MKVLAAILLLSASVASALPSASPNNWQHNSRTPKQCVCRLPRSLAQPVAPLAAGSNPLPPVRAGLSLKRITVGYGYQLFDCSKLGADAAPAANGAKAVLYDANCAATYRGGSRLHAVPAQIVRQGLNAAVATRALKYAGEYRPRLTSKHYFEDPTTPVFIFTDGSGDKFVSQVVERTPVSVTPPAFPWVRLIRKAGRENESRGITEMYRLVTAGGVAPKTCGKWAGSKRMIEVPYATEYWWYI